MLPRKSSETGCSREWGHSGPTRRLASQNPRRAQTATAGALRDRRENSPPPAGDPGLEVSQNHHAAGANKGVGERSITLPPGRQSGTDHLGRDPGGNSFSGISWGTPSPATLRELECQEGLVSSPAAMLLPGGLVPNGGASSRFFGNDGSPGETFTTRPLSPLRARPVVGRGERQHNKEQRKKKPRKQSRKARTGNKISRH